MVYPLYCLVAMCDVKCTRCGMVTSYADASIENMRETCEVTETFVINGEERKADKPTKHKFEEVQ